MKELFAVVFGMLAPLAAGALLFVLTAAIFVFVKVAVVWLMRIWEDL